MSVARVEVLAEQPITSDNDDVCILSFKWLNGFTLFLFILNFLKGFLLKFEGWNPVLNKRLGVSLYTNINVKDLPNALYLILDILRSGLNFDLNIEYACLFPLIGLIRTAEQ